MQGSVTVMGYWDSYWYIVTELDPMGESSLAAMSHWSRPLVEAAKRKIVLALMENHVEVNGSDVEDSTAYWDLLAVCAVNLAKAQLLVEAAKRRIVLALMENHVEVNGSDVEDSTAYWDLLAVSAVDLAMAQQLVKASATVPSERLVAAQC